MTQLMYAQTLPITQSKLDSYAKRLHSVEQFIKEKYVLTKMSIYASVSALHLEYGSSCDNSSIKSIVGKIHNLITS